MPGAKRAQWGWHRLTDRWAEQIVADACVASDDLVLDVGAGTGALTGPLAATGARVIAIELHPERAALLRDRFSNDTKVKVVRADGADLWLPRRPFRVVANPPFAITTALLTRLTAPGSSLLTADLVLQRGSARRWADDLRLAHAGFVADVHRLIPRSAFDPRPHVDAAVLRIGRRSRRRR